LDLEVALLIGAALVGIVVGLLHLVGYVPPRYRRMLREVQASTADAIGTRLEAILARFEGEEGSDPLEGLNVRLEALAARLEAFTPSAIGEAVGAQLRALQDEAMKQLESVQGAIPPEITGAMGGTVTQSNRKMADLKNAVGQGLLGPYGALIEQFMPPLYEYLVENPDMVVKALEMPVIQKLIQRAAAMAGKVGGGGGEGGSVLGLGT